MTISESKKRKRGNQCSNPKAKKAKTDTLVDYAREGDLESIIKICQETENKYSIDFFAAELEAATNFHQPILDFFSENAEISQIIKAQFDFKIALKLNDRRKVQALIVDHPDIIHSKINRIYPLFFKLNKGDAQIARSIIQSIKTPDEISEYIEENKNADGLNAIQDARKRGQDRYARALINLLPRSERSDYTGKNWLESIKHRYRTHNDLVSEARQSQTNLYLNLANNTYTSLVHSLPFFSLGPLAVASSFAMNFSTTYASKAVLEASKRYFPKKLNEVINPIVQYTSLGLDAYQCYQNPIGYFGGKLGGHLGVEIAATMTDNPEWLGFAYFSGALLGKERAVHFSKELERVGSNELFKLSDFDVDLSVGKTQGVTTGNFYFDQYGQKWLIKHPHSSLTLFNEYVGGALFKILIPNHVPEETILVLNQAVAETNPAKLLIGSKIIDGFESMLGRSVFHDKDDIVKFSGILDVSFAVSFLGEIDLNPGNIGTAFNRFIKIDHGYTFSTLNSPLGPDEVLSDVERILGRVSRYRPLSLQNFSFDEVSQAVSKIADSSIQEIEKTISERSRLIHNYFSETGQDVDISKSAEASIILSLREHHKTFKSLKTYLSIEKAAIDHDETTLSKILDTDIDMNTYVTPLFNSGKKTLKDLVKAVYPEYHHPRLAAFF